MIFLTSPDNIQSNQVLEYEHSDIMKKIESLERSHKPVPEDILDLKSAYEIKMNMLVTNIQLGKLDMAGYLAMVKKDIEEAKNAALQFKKIGNLDLANRALIRLKLMKAEVSEAESNA